MSQRCPWPALSGWDSVRSGALSHRSNTAEECVCLEGGVGLPTNLLHPPFVPIHLPCHSSPILQTKRNQRKQTKLQGPAGPTRVITSEEAIVACLRFTLAPPESHEAGPGWVRGPAR